MDLNDRRGLKAAAREARAKAKYDPKKLMLIHAGITAAAGLLVTLVGYLLQLWIEDTGGLGGVGTRTMLETAQNVLNQLFSLVLPFWQIGFVYATVQIIRGRRTEPDSLQEGFRRAWPVLKTQLWMALFTCGLIFACFYAAYFLYAMTPLSEGLLTALMNGSEEELLAAMEEAMLPITIMMLPPLLVVGTYFVYRMRLVDYVVMDESGIGGIGAIRRGWKLTKGNFGKLFKLDLSYWWYYLLMGLTVLVAYGDLILTLLGISLPWSKTDSSYGCLALSYVLQFLLLWWKGAQVQLTYAAFYEAALPKETPNE